MNIYVITSTNYTKLLPEFAERFEKYWGKPFFVYVSNTDIKHWSDGIIKFLESIEDEYFILLSEDFYLTGPVDKELIKELWGMRAGYDRVSLLGNHTPERTVRNGKYFTHKEDAEYQFSFEASIQKRGFLLEYLKAGYDPWEMERIRAKTGKGFIISSEHPAIFYQDKSRQLQIQ